MSDRSLEPKPTGTTLGDVLYAGQPHTVPESEWVALVKSIAAGNQAALHALYARSHRPVFTLVVRMAASRQTAEEVTLDVFHDVWRRASRYDPEAGTVLGWIMNQARSRAIDRLRFDQRKKRRTPDAGGVQEPAPSAALEDVMILEQQAATLHQALDALSADQRQAIEQAYFRGFTYAEVAERLEQPLGTVKTRVRAALHMLRQALVDEDDP